MHHDSMTSYNTHDGMEWLHFFTDLVYFFFFNLSNGKIYLFIKMGKPCLKWRFWKEKKS